MIPQTRRTVRLRRQRTAPTTVVVAVKDVPTGPRPMSGGRRAQLMDVYVRLLEEVHGMAVRREDTFSRFWRLSNTITILRLRLGR